MSTATQVYVSPLATNQVALQTNTNQRLTSQIAHRKHFANLLRCPPYKSNEAAAQRRLVAMTAGAHTAHQDLCGVALGGGDLRCDVECTSHTLEGNLEKE